MRSVLLCLSLLWALIASATTVRVPSDYASIQAALNVIVEGDTVLVGLGTYAEEAIAPAFSFVLKGDVNADTGDYPRPIIDPSSLPQPNTRACLRLQGGHPVIEDLLFHNGPGMRQDRAYASAGGISTNSGSALTVRRCVFDSVWCAIGSGNIPLTLEDCVFRGDTAYCINNAEAVVRATRCTFTSQGGWSIELVAAGDSSVFNSCRFRDAFEHCTYLTLFNAPHFRIAGCIFGPGSPHEPVVRCTGAHRAYIEDNLFTGLACDGGNPLRLGTDLQDTMFIRRNHFVNNRESCFIQIAGGPPDGYGFCTALDSNVFEDCTVTGYWIVSKAFSSARRMVGRGNRFVRLSGPRPSVLLEHDSLSVLRDNIFQNNGWALSSDLRTDARWTWWGDRTGPCDTLSNPHARGDTITGMVDFVPWISDTNLLSPPAESVAWARESGLDVSPNPFNSVTRISYELERAGRVRLAVYDLQGRLVRTLCDEVKAAGRHEVLFEGEGLSSGTYFVRLEAGGGKRVQKVMLLK